MAIILIVEDESILRDLMMAELEKQGYTVYTASNGAEGWRLALEVNPDLILLDLLMPVMSGYDFLKHLRAEEQFKDTPCVVLSNSGQADDLNRAYECGANDVLIKAEFNPEHLVLKVEEALVVH